MAEEEVKSSPAPCWSNIVKKQPPPMPNRQELNAAADKVFVESCKSAKGIAVAVVDSTAIIQGGESLSSWADKFVSVSEVMGEIRDPMSRHRLNFIPFTVETKEPSPEALKKVINFARATGDLHTLSDVDLKLIALTYTLEAQIHGTQHLRDSPPAIHTVNVRRLPEKDMPGWGSNVPNPEEWEALEQAEDKSNHTSRILPLKDLNLNVVPTDSHSTAAGDSTGSGELHAENQENTEGSSGKPRKYFPQKKEINIEGKKMVASGIDASQGQVDDNAGDWLPAVSRSTHRRFLRRKAKRDAAGALSERDSQQDEEEEVEPENSDQLTVESSDGAKITNDIPEKRNAGEGKSTDDDISTILNQMRLEEDSFEALQEEEEGTEQCEGLEPNSSTEDGVVTDNNESISVDVENANGELEDVDTSSQTEASFMDDNSSEQSWMLRSLSESSVACITSDFAMQNVLLQMGLRLLAPGGMQIRELHRWILRCHACFKVTTEIGRIFCPSCGNGGTLRKVAVTVGQNGIVVAARRPRTSLRGTRFSLPLPQGGRNAVTKNPVLREDQLPRKFLYPKTKKKNNKEGDELFASSDIFSHHTDKRAPLQPPVRKALAVFSGKRNPNDNHHNRATAKH